MDATADFTGYVEIHTASGAVYYLAQADAEGNRDVLKEPGDLPFNRCKLVGSGECGFFDEGTVLHEGVPVIGEQLALSYVNPDTSEECLWFSSRIESIKQA